MDEGFEALGAGMFRECISLTAVELPTSVSHIAPRAFADCSALKELTLPATVKTVGKQAFAGCTSLEHVEMELGVEGLGAGAFARTPALREVTVPHSLKRLGFGAFGLGKSKEKVILYVDNEYMVRRMKQQLFLCGSFLRVRVEAVGKTLDQRKRERRRTTLEQEPVHLTDLTDPNRKDE